MNVVHKCTIAATDKAAGWHWAGGRSVRRDYLANSIAFELADRTAASAAHIRTRIPWLCNTRSCTSTT